MQRRSLATSPHAWAKAFCQCTWSNQSSKVETPSNNAKYYLGNRVQSMLFRRQFPASWHEISPPLDFNALSSLESLPGELYSILTFTLASAYTEGFGQTQSGVVIGTPPHPTTHETPLLCPGVKSLLKPQKSGHKGLTPKLWKVNDTANRS